MTRTETVRRRNLSRKAFLSRSSCVGRHRSPKKGARERCLFLCSRYRRAVVHARSFAKPPKQVQTVCECILIMRGYKELNWKTAKGMMSEANFLRSLMEIDFDSIGQAQVKSIRGKMDRQQGRHRGLSEQGLAHLYGHGLYKSISFFPHPGIQILRARAPRLASCFQAPRGKEEFAKWDFCKTRGPGRHGLQGYSEHHCGGRLANIQRIV